VAICERRGIGGAIGRCTKGGLVIMVIGADHIQIVSDGVFHAGPEHMEQLVAGVESGVRDIRAIDRIAGGAQEISRDISKAGTGGKTIAGGRILNEFVSSKQLERPIAVFSNQHHARIVGERSSENLRRHRRQGVAGNRYRDGVLDVAADCIERKCAASQIGDVAADLELVRASRGIVQIVAPELPERRYPELANIDAYFTEVVNRQSSVLPTPQVVPCQPIGEKAYEAPSGS
jgi:hypothetical protein